MNERPRGPGYYPGFSTMAQKEFWDDATRTKVEQRLQPKPIRFFSDDEARTMQAVLDCVMPQDDRAPDARIPVLAAIDEKLYDRQSDGFTYEGTPDADKAYRIGLRAIEGLAQDRYRTGFADLELIKREELLLTLRDGTPDAGWPSDELPPRHFWKTVVKDAISAYYAHPYAWDEIGFGGPAYPRGYIRLTDGLLEPWEVKEQRHEWQAPADTRSDAYQDNTEYFVQPRRYKP